MASNAIASSLNGPWPRGAQLGVSTARPGAVDGRAGEHRVAFLEPAFARRSTRTSASRHRRVLREVGEHLRRLDRQRGKAAQVAREGLAQVELAAVQLGLGGQPAPSGFRSDRSAARPSQRFDHAVPAWAASTAGADAFGQLLGGHRVLVERPAEARLVVLTTWMGRLGGRGRIERASGRGLGRLRLRQQLGADGEQVATGQRDRSGRRCGSSRPSPRYRCRISCGRCQICVTDFTPGRWRRRSWPRPQAAPATFFHQS